MTFFKKKFKKKKLHSNVPVYSRMNEKVSKLNSKKPNIYI